MEDGRGGRQAEIVAKVIETHLARRLDGEARELLQHLIALDVVDAIYS